MLRRNRQTASRGRPIGFWKGLAFRLIAVTLVTSGTCLILEVVIRLVWGPPPNIAPYTPLALSEHRLYTARKPSGGWRAVVVGDSITRGFGIRHEETYHEVLEQIIKKRDPERRHSGPCEVISIAGQGAAPAAYAEALERIGLTFDPDLVLVGFCLNDFVPDAIDDRMPRCYIRARSVHYWLRSRSRLWYVAGESLRVLGFRLRWLREDQMYGHLAYAWDTRSPAFRKDWEATQPALRAIARMCSARRIQCLIVAFPYDFQLDEAALARYRSWGVDCPREALDGRPQAVLRRFCREEGLLFLDLLPAFRRLPPSDRAGLFLERYPSGRDYCHPSVSGHRVAGEAIAELLAAQRAEAGLTSDLPDAFQTHAETRP